MCIPHTEVFADELGSRMHLQTQVTSTHGIQEVETNREVLTEACFYRFAKQVLALQQNQVYRRYFETHTVHFKIKAVFFRHTVEAPAIVIISTIQVAHFLHPLSAPWSRVEERNHTERSLDSFFNAPEEGFLINHLRFSSDVGIDPELNLVEQSVLVFITDSPVIKIASLVLNRNGIVTIVYTQRLHFATTETELDFPTRHVDIYHHCIFRCNQSSSRTDDNNGFSSFADFLLNSHQLVCIEIIFHAQIGYITVKYVIGHEAVGHYGYFCFRLHHVAYIDYFSCNPFRKSFQYFFFMYSCI